MPRAPLARLVLRLGVCLCLPREDAAVATQDILVDQLDHRVIDNDNVTAMEAAMEAALQEIRNASPWAPNARLAGQSAAGTEQPQAWDPDGCTDYPGKLQTDCWFVFPGPPMSVMPHIGK